MIILDIKQKQIDEAQNLYKFKNLKGSITNGQSNIYGALGEVIVYDYFKDKKYNIIKQNTYDYDLIINGYKVDVKTKKTSVTPLSHYLCSISDFNTKQKCDYYFFLRVKIDFTKSYLLGYISKKDFYQYSFFKYKGDIDINGFIFKDNCYNIEIEKLNNFKIEGK